MFRTRINKEKYYQPWPHLNSGIISLYNLALYWDLIVWAFSTLFSIIWKQTAHFNCWNISQLTCLLFIFYFLNASPKSINFFAYFKIYKIRAILWSRFKNYCFVFKKNYLVNFLYWKKFEKLSFIKKEI